MRLKTLIPKSEARKLVVERRTEISHFEIKNKTKEMIENLSSIDDFAYANSVFCYVNSRPGEVDTRTLIDYMVGQGKSVFLPKLNKETKSFRRFHFTGWDSLVKNSEGYWEPALGLDEDLSDIDIIIVPALAVSTKGQRIGYGGGYYDKLLHDIQTPKYVLAFEFQLFKYIESTPHDIRVDKIITERRIINTKDDFEYHT
ncbi:MAG: 5-formyltetrahydrofolate cyclo-ligase [Ignavibacteriae bacterium]|nr:5-formyltetrahydrofolate cyclo-ligase [Ignavibacteriota bacterium]NOH00358.1 5-formyltetrahydrofolate cyclo-ligase [Ignavibacteriota bacterium]